MSKSYIKMQNTFIKINKKLYKIFSLPAELVHMSPQFISSHNIESVKICSLSSFWENRDVIWKIQLHTDIISADAPGLSSTSQYIPAIISFKIYEWALSTNILCVTILRQVQFGPYQHIHYFPLEKISTYQDVISKQKCLYIFLNIYNYAHLSPWAHISLNHQQS